MSLFQRSSLALTRPYRKDGRPCYIATHANHVREQALTGSKVLEIRSVDFLQELNVLSP